MPGQAISTIFQEGAFSSDVRNSLNTSLSNMAATAPNMVATINNSAFPFGSFGTAITLLAATAPAGTYRVTIYGVVTTTITTATSWLFTIAYTDDKQAQTPTVCTSSTMTAGTDETGTLLFRSNGTAAITVTPTSASAAAGAIAYSLVLERLI